MHTQDILLGIIIICLLYWYFNVRGITKCIIYNKDYDNIKCIRQKLD
jgi:hypothetical protein